MKITKLVFKHDGGTDIARKLLTIDDTGWRGRLYIHVDSYDCWRKQYNDFDDIYIIWGDRRIRVKWLFKLLFRLFGRRIR